MRTIITIQDYDVEILDNICNNEKVTRAAAIRQAIKDYIEKKSRNNKAAFGAFKDIFNNEDSVTIQRKLRKEWNK
ncbi:MAG: hypothetical protein K0R14_584 [Burkholderiales bacterium]|jgi:metal-responsive CopG/Arc/MetJ family transcriptional regulator|nr:hypothetical protein [Burkholderiales bacterium]